MEVEKIWLKSYPPGVPAEINPDAYHSLVELLEQSFMQYSERPAFYNLGTTLTYKQIDHLSRDLAAYLQQELKLKKGDRIAIMLPNLLQYPIALFGALRAGLIVVNTNPLYTEEELFHQLNSSHTTNIITLANFASTVEKVLARLPLKNIIVTEVGDLLPFVKGNLLNLLIKYVLRKIPAWHIPGAIKFKEVLAKGKQLTFNPVSINCEDVAFLQFTGGTTGISKGAILTHRNITTNLQQITAWFQALLVGGQETIITALPLYHIFSLTGNCFFFTKIGGLNVLITNPRDIPYMVKEIKKFRFSAITGVNTLFNALLKNTQFCKLDFSSLRLTLGGGMAVQRAIADKWKEITGVIILEAYGLTETSPCATINPPDLKAYNGTIGLPVSSTEVAILDDEHNALAIGKAGEIAIKGPQVTKGYWENPRETAKVFTADGWLLTGDIGTMDENGYVKLLERKKDMILVSGFNVYPNQIEDVIARLPGVREVAVVGMPDENSGEAPKAFIIKDDPNLTAEQVIKHCRQYLTHYKIPKQIVFSDELPKTNVGKILRRALKTG